MASDLLWLNDLVLIGRSRAGRKGRHDPDGSPTPLDVAIDVLLQRAVVLARVRRGRGQDPLAGLKVDDDDLTSLLASLPGLEGDDPTTTKTQAGLVEQLGAASDALAQAIETDTNFSRLALSARLGPIDAEVLALLCAIEADPRRQRLVGYLNDDVTQKRLSMFSLSEVLGDSDGVVAAVMPGGRLRRAALLAPLGDQPWSSATIAAAPALLWAMNAEGFVDPELPAGTEVFETFKSGEDGLVVASGPDRRRRLEAVLGRIGAARAIVSTLPTTAAQWDALVRYATVRVHGVVLDIADTLPAEARDRIEEADHLPWAIVSETDLPLSALFRRAWVEADVAPAEASDEEWAASFPTADRSAEGAAGAYRLSASQLHDAARAAAAHDGDLAEAVRRLAAGHIESTAMRVRPTRSWDDLVLDDERMSLVREISLRQRRRDVVYEKWGFSPQPSTGVVALFAGPSGTGKTLAAEIVAADLGVDLYKIDLANLVSKYIGETEKNLARVFEAAEASSVVLFFDEADALLGKRSSVSDAHDRYANIEVAYLLQRLERYEGVAVLATNLASNIDQAFQRRLHVIVEFAMPQPPERLQIWRRSMPKMAPIDTSVDLERLSEEIEVSGGTIRNICLRSAFLAAEAGTPITMEVVLVAMRREFGKLGRLANSSQWNELFSDSKR